LGGQNRGVYNSVVDVPAARTMAVIELKLCTGIFSNVTIYLEKGEGFKQVHSEFVTHSPTRKKIASWTEI